MTQHTEPRTEETAVTHEGMTEAAKAEIAAKAAQKAEETWTANFSTALSGFLPLKSAVTVTQDKKQIEVKPGQNVFVGVKRVNQARTRAEVQILAMASGVDMTKTFVIPLAAIDVPEKAKTAGASRQSTARVRGDVEKAYYAALAALLGESFSKSHAGFTAATKVQGGMSAEAIKALAVKTFPGLTWANYQAYVKALAALTEECNQAISKAQTPAGAEVCIDILSATVNHGHKVFAIARAANMF